MTYSVCVAPSRLQTRKVNRMSHELDMSNGRANMAFVQNNAEYKNGTPWHGLGQLMKQGATIEEWLIAGGLNFNIEKRPMVYGVNQEDGSIAPQVIDGQFAHIRDDTQAFIGQGSSQFKLVQPSEVLEFYRDLVDSSDYSIETVGSLFGGSKIWALAKSKQDINLQGDLIKPYLMLSTANDGSSATVADFTSVRVVCNNTLSMALGKAKSAIKVRHNTEFNADTVKHQLGVSSETVNEFSDAMQELISAQVSPKQTIQFFIDLYGKTNSEGEVTNEKQLKAVMPSLLKAVTDSDGADLPTAKGTAFGMLQALTNYVDFNTRSRSQENRFNSSQFGEGAKLKTQALNTALELVRS